MTRIILALLIVGSIAGCRAWYGLDSPEMSLHANKLLGTVTYRNSKDVDAKVKYDPETKAFELEVKSDASTVREANANQMDRVNALHQTMGQTADRMVARFDDLSRSLLPGGVKALGSAPVSPFWYIVAAGLFLLLLLLIAIRAWRPARR